MFAQLNKRSFTTGSIAKSLTFKDMLKMLPNEKDLDYPEKAWKFDRNSPWVNDLDLNEDNAVAIDKNLELQAAKWKAISNINVRIDADDSDGSETEALKKEMKPKLGSTSVEKLNKIRLSKLKQSG